jgi:glyoxylase-like metal-dependent hydrolase (beta-lactamase superfamily II)
MPELMRLSPHVVYLPADVPDRPALCAVSGPRGTVMLDGGSSDAHARLFLDALAAHGIPAPRFVALTHWHWDHVFGAAETGAAVIALRETADQLRIMAAQAWDDAALAARVASGEEIPFCAENIALELPEPRRVRIAEADIVFSGVLSLDLGGVTCHIHHVGGDHAADACVMHVPEDGVLFLGDCLYEAVYAPVRYYTRARLLPLLDRIESFGAAVCIEGHADAPTSASVMQGVFAGLRRAAAITTQANIGTLAEAEAAWAAQTGAPPDDDAREFLAAFLAGRAYEG